MDVVERAAAGLARDLAPPAVPVARLRKATVTAVGADGTVTVTLAGVDVPGVPWLGALLPASGDVVWVLVQGGLVLGLGQAMAVSRPATATVGTAQTTTSTAFTDLATPGPSVTVLARRELLVAVFCLMSNSTQFGATLMGFQVSGATAIAPTDPSTITYGNPATNNALRASGLFHVSGLTPGTHTITAKYRVTSGTGTFADRKLLVIPLP